MSNENNGVSLLKKKHNIIGRKESKGRQRKAKSKQRILIKLDSNS